MFKSFRFRLILLPAIVLALLAGCDGSEQRAAGYLDKGRGLYEEGNYVKARLELKNALQINGKLADAWYLLGRIAQREQEWQTAFASYGKALELDPDHIDAMVEQGKIFLAAGKQEEAQSAADKALALNPKNPDALLLRAALENRAGDTAAAEASAKEALAADPTNEQAYAMLAVGYGGKGQTGDAEKILLDGLKHSPNSVPLRVLLANLYRSEKKQEEEIRLRREIAERLPEKSEAAYSLAQTLAAYDKVDEAEKVLRERIATYPDEMRSRLMLVELLRERRSPEAAEKEFKAQIDAVVEPEELQLALARQYLADKRVDDAKVIFRALIERRGTAASGLEARKKLAGILMSEGDKKGAASLIAEVLEQSPKDGDALTARATLRLVDKDIDGAIADLRPVVADRPDSLPATLLLVRAYLANGDTALALDRLERFVHDNPTADNAALQLASFYGRLGRIDDAERQLKKTAERGADNGAALKGLIELYLKTGRPQPAIEMAETMRNQFPKDPSSHYLLGLARQAAGEHTLAITAFEAALELEPNGIQPLTGLVSSRLALGQGDEALSTLDEMIAKNPKNVVALNLRGEVLAHEQRIDPALTAFEQASSVRSDWAVPYLNRANLLQGQGRAAEAEAVLRAGVEATQETPALVVRLAALLQSQGNRAGAIELYRSLLAKSPELDIAYNNLAALLAESPQDTDAMAEALKLAQRFKKSPNPLYRDTLGWILYKSGQPEQAIPHLEAAAAGAPERPDILYHLGMAYKAAGRTVDAKQQLERAVALDKDFPERELAKTELAKP